ncbi:MAG TPA: protein kinase [Bryobacteraceae bacterium]|nr:protein kinase [Bryobacteraceae bacterium]
MEQIGRYQILGELGRGATGVVYRAQDPAIGRIIAIKTIRLSDITDHAERERLRERLFREAQSAGILSHPNIVTIYDIAEENGLAYIFMECVDGPPLEKVMGNPDPMPGSNVLSILRQTATALDYAHKKGIVHRDIKPANILIHEGNVAKITDFGVAKILSQQMTQSGVMMGTPNYMSPEQVQGHAVDGRADQFSLAVIAYEMLTGEKPFLADQLPALLFRIVREDPVAPERLNPSIGPPIEEVLRKALAKAPNDRYLSCLEFIDALNASCHASPGWHPMPRASAQNLPTMAGPVAPPPPPRPAVRELDPLPPAAPPAPGPMAFDPSPRLLREEPESRNPLLKSLMWMLIGIGLVGLVLFGAQKYLFNRNAEPAATTADASPQAAPPQSTPDNSNKPSPVGEAKTPGQTAQEQPPAGPPPDTAPASTTPEAQPPTAPAPSTSSESKPPETKPPETKPTGPKPAETTPIEPPRRRVERAASPPIVPAPVPRAAVNQSIQFITEPPGAQVTVDGNGTQVCRTPCIMPLSPGRHAVSVDLRGYRSYPKVINVPQDSDVFLQLAKATGTLSITSNPPGASIEIDGLTQAKKTPALFDLPPGNYRVRVSRNGAFLDFDVQLRDGEFQNKRVDF